MVEPFSSTQERCEEGRSDLTRKCHVERACSRNKKSDFLRKSPFLRLPILSESETREKQLVFARQ